MDSWTAKTARAEMKKFKEHYEGKTPRGGMMIFSLCVMMVGIGIAILRHVEAIHKLSTGRVADTEVDNGS